MLITRILAAAIFAPLVLAVVWMGGEALAAMCLLLGLLMMWEYLRMMGPMPIFMRATGYLGVVMCTARILGHISLEAAVVPGTVVLMCLTALIVQPLPIEKAWTRAAQLTFGVFYCGGMLPFLAALRAREADGLILALMVVLGTWAADTGAYFTGRLVGRKPLHRVVSPKKTMEGFVGGMVAAVAACMALGALSDGAVAPQSAVYTGILVGLLGMFGDLGESLLKRSADVKDSSQLIPGHGGVLDRFDAMMFVAVAVYVYVSYYGI